MHGLSYKTTTIHRCQLVLTALIVKKPGHSTCRVFLYDARLGHLGIGGIYIPVPKDAQPLRLPEQHGIRQTSPSLHGPPACAAKVTPSIHSLLLVCIFRRCKLPGQISKRLLTTFISDHAKCALAARDSHPMQRFGVAAFLAVAFVANVKAQSQYTTPGPTTSAPLSAATTYTPTNVWAPNPTCSSGSSAVAQNGGYGGGVYRDDFGSYWEVLCNYDWTGTVWYDNPNGPK